MESETNGLPQPLYASEAATLNGKDVIQLPLRKQDVGNSMNKSSTMKSIEDGVAKKALQSNDEPRYSNFDDESLSGGEDDQSDESGVEQPEVVALWNPRYKMKVTSALCPTPDNLNEFLQQHPNLEVYSGQDQVINAAKSFDNFDKISYKADAGNEAQTPVRARPPGMPAMMTFNHLVGKDNAL